MQETCVTNSVPILAIQLCRFSDWGGQLIKDKTLVSCSQLVSNMRKVILTIPPNTFFFTEKCNLFPGSTRISFWKGVLSFWTLSLGVTIPHIMEVLYGTWVCSLNFQALQPCSPFFRRSNTRWIDQSWSCIWGLMTSYMTPVHLAINCGKAEC